MMRAEHEQRIQRLKRDFAHLFAGNSIGISIAPGWFTIVHDACREIDALLDPAEEGKAWFTYMAEEQGSLTIYMNILRTNFVSSPPAVLRYLELLEETGTAVVADKIGPIVMEAETRSCETCMLCGAPGRLRKADVPQLTLCKRHVGYGYSHLDLAFEQVTDPDRDPVAPGRGQVAAVLLAHEIQFRGAGVVRLGLLSPTSAAAPWRLIVENGRAEHAVRRVAESLVGWPLDLVNQGEDAHRYQDVFWILG